MRVRVSRCVIAPVSGQPECGPLAIGPSADPCSPTDRLLRVASGATGVRLVCGGSHIVLGLVLIETGGFVRQHGRTLRRQARGMAWEGPLSDASRIADCGLRTGPLQASTRSSQQSGFGRIGTLLSATRRCSCGRDRARDSLLLLPATCTSTRTYGRRAGAWAKHVEMVVCIHWYYRRLDSQRIVVRIEGMGDQQTHQLYCFIVQCLARWAWNCLPRWLRTSPERSASCARLASDA